MKNLYEGNWNWGRFIKYLLPSMFTMLVLALYTLVDGLFVAHYVGGDGLAGINIAFPFFSLAFGFAIMISTGGSTLVSIRLGEGKKKEANEKFTLTIILILIISILLCVLGLIFLNPIVNILGASELLAPYARSYLLYIMISLPLFLPKIAFEFLLRTDGAPDKAFNITLITGLLNIILDYIFMGPLAMGIAGAALGTVLAGSVGTILSFLHFISSKSNLKFTRPVWDRTFTKDSLVNGSSEMVNELSGGFTTFLFNIIILKTMGESGVAAISALFLLNFVMISLLLGTSMGFAPIVSFFHGAKDKESENRIASRALKLMLLLSLILFLAFQGGASLFARLFDHSGEGFGEILKKAISLFSLAYLFNGFNIYASNYFTALNMGKTSALIALSRSFIGVLLGILILPPILGSMGIWLAVPFSEALTFVLSMSLLLKKKRVSILNIKKKSHHLYVN